MTRFLRGLVAPLLAYLGRLRSPWLVAVAGALFLFDLLIPDLLPFVDEILLGLITLLLARRRTGDEQ